MNDAKYTPSVFSALLLGLLLSLPAVGVALAAAGNIDATNKWAWGTNMGWVNFAPDNGGVTVYSDHLEGYAWAENVGWIKLGACTGGSPCTHANTTNSNYGVNNDGTGKLSGYAWSTTVGWINFDPAGAEQVTMNPATGDFSGYAWGENVGWIHFQGSSPAYKVSTAWRGAADVGIVKTVAPAIVVPGSPLTYTLRFTNSGPNALSGVVISDSIPLSVTISSVTSSTVGSGIVIAQTSAGPNFAWAVSDLAVGAGGVITLTGTLSPHAAATGALITNTATITASNDITAGNNLASAAFSVLATLHVTRTGTGSGIVVSSPAGITCGVDCTETLGYGTVITLTSTPATGSTFTGWSGACTGSGACVVTMNGAKNVTATFTLNSYALTTATAGTGSGTVTLSPAGGTYSHGTVVTVTNTPAAGSTFTGWSGACTGSGACVVTMNGAKSVTATFTLNSYALTTATAGTGSGTVILSPAGGIYSHGTVVTVTNTPATGSTFTEWSGACTGSGACVVMMNGAKSVTVTFGLDSLDGFAVLVQPASGLTTSEAGASATFTVVLTAQPTAPVTVTLASSDVSEGTVGPAQMIFTGADWSAPQVATVTGVDDDVDDGDVAYTIVTTVGSADPNDNGLAAADVSVTNIDDDGVATANTYLPLILKPGAPVSAEAVGETMGSDGIPGFVAPNRSPAPEPGGAPVGTNPMFLPLVNP